MSKNRVFIYGSCVSRDTFEYLDPEQFELVQYVARQSALSAYTRPVTMVEPPRFDSPFQERMVSGDYASSMQTLVPEAATRTDLVLVDLVDERLGAYVLPDGSVITRSTELIQSGAEQQLPPGSQHLPFGSEQHFQYWSQGIAAVGELFRHHMPRAAVVLLDIPWAATSETGSPTPPSFGVTATEANPIFRAYTQAAARALGAETITLQPDEVASSPDHPWGEAPFHYAQSVYIDVVEKLTGAPGRPIRKPQAHQSHAINSSGQNSNLSMLTSGFWRLTLADGSVAGANLRFLQDGEIWGADKKRYSRWELRSGKIVLRKHQDSETYARFEVPPSGITKSLRGRLEGGDRSELELAAVELDWIRRPRPSGSMRRQLASEIKRHKWKIGDHSYGKPNIVGAGRAALEIGKFCWIDSGAKLLLSTRRFDTPSLYSFQTTHAYWPSGRQHRPENSAAPIHIGNDVRIEHGAIIKAGVAIGDGAYIGHNAVVSNDVIPYAIVEGASGDVVGMRFRDDQVTELVKIAWWDWSDSEIDAALPYMAEGIDQFLAYARSRP